MKIFFTCILALKLKIFLNKVFLIKLTLRFSLEDHFELPYGMSEFEKISLSGIPQLKDVIWSKSGVGKNLANFLANDKKAMERLVALVPNV